MDNRKIKPTLICRLKKIRDHIGQKILILLLIVMNLHSYGQNNSSRPMIDSAAYAQWSYLGNYHLSSNGDYLAYEINNKPRSSRTLVVRSANGEWQQTFVGGKFVDFTKDSRKAILTLRGDSLAVLSLGGSAVSYINPVQTDNIRLSADDWLFYQEKDSVSMFNLKTGIRKAYEGLLLQKAPNSLFISSSTSDVKKIMQIVLLTSEKKIIWEGQGLPLNVQYNTERRALAFYTQEKPMGQAKNIIWYYREGQNKAIKLLSDSTIGIPHGFSVSSVINFNASGNKLFVTIDSIQKKLRIPRSGLVLWDYKTGYLPTENGRWGKSAKLSINLDSKKIVTVNTTDEEARNLEIDYIKNERFVLVNNIGKDVCFNCSDVNYISLVSLEDGERQIIDSVPNKGHSFSFRSLSPDERFVLWFNPDSLSYYSYEIATGIKKNVSTTVPVDLYDKNVGLNQGIYFGLAGWLTDRHSMLLYDQYDIWQVDLSGKEKAKCITQGIGRLNNITFHIVNDNNGVGYLEHTDELLLDAFNNNNKQNGFWKLSLARASKPVICNMEDYAYYIGRVGRISGAGQFQSAGKPVKALNKNVYLVPRMSASESANLFITKDFKSFTPVSDIHPEKNYNWLNTELVKWVLPDGTTSAGILYKPENFDPSKKYPLIFDYYEQRSDEVNGFIVPAFSRGRIDIPTYVSNGYLVFTPDIYYRRGHDGQSVVDAIVSAARFLSKRSYVDATKLGLQGHSYGGWETNYLVTHTQNIFAAACTGSGVSNQISGYNQLPFGGEAKQQRYFELVTQGSGPYGLGVTPWTNTKLYLENSPVFGVGNVTTPLLIMHGKRDDMVPFEQAIEMFRSMKRAGKKVWLLEYSNAGHTVEGQDGVDFTKRMQQFFDHYLKGVPPPEWMTDGISDEPTAVETSFTLDTSGKQP